MSSWLDSLLFSRRPLDFGKPEGAFKLCERQEHVIEFWFVSCPECSASAVDPPEPIESLPPEAPEPLAPLAPPEPLAPLAPPVPPRPPEPTSPPPLTFVPNVESAPVNAPSLDHLPPVGADASSTAIFRKTPAPVGEIPGSSRTVHTYAPEERRVAWGRLHITIELTDSSYQLNLGDQLGLSPGSAQVTSRSAALSQEGGQLILRAHPRAQARMVNRRSAPGPDGLRLESGDQVELSGITMRFEQLPDRRGE